MHIDPLSIAKPRPEPMTCQGTGQRTKYSGRLPCIQQNRALYHQRRERPGWGDRRRAHRWAPTSARILLARYGSSGKRAVSFKRAGSSGGALCAPCEPLSPKGTGVGLLFSSRGRDMLSSLARLRSKAFERFPRSATGVLDLPGR